MSDTIGVITNVITVNASGLSCPQPVLETKKILDKNPSGRVEVLVDTATSRDNVTRFAENKGWKAVKEEREGGYKVLLEKSEK
jgi:TusA-related sulfurtransferase